MQLISVYLYPNKIDVFTNAETAWKTERYRQVYNHNLKIYRGVDNRIDLQVRNSDEKAAPTSSTLVFNLVERERQQLVAQKECTAVDADRGRFYVNITEQMLDSIEQGYYQYSVVAETRQYAEDGTYIVTNKTPMYSASQYASLGNIEILGAPTGEAQRSIVVDTFEERNPATTGYAGAKFFLSSLIDANPLVSTAFSVHSFQIYSTNYSGQLIIQASQDNGGTPHIWTDLQTIDPSTDEFVNIVGKWHWFRIKHIPATLNTGTIDKVLYR